MKNQADTQYRELVQAIEREGYSDSEYPVRPKWADGTPAYTKSVIARSLHFDGTEVPILTTKRVAWQSAIKELLWIWQKKSNVVQDLRDMGVNIWNEWELPDGTIGTAYGYQLAKKNRKVPGPKYMEVDGRIRRAFVMADQVDALIQGLKENPASRRHLTTLWNPDDLDAMALTPCVYETQWHVKGGRLHLEVRCRSNDAGLGLPFNIFQYHVLHRMMAQVTGYGLGEFHYAIGDAHLYERHLGPVLEQVERDVYPVPELWINPAVTDFYAFTVEDFELHNYEHGPTIRMEVAI